MAGAEAGKTAGLQAVQNYTQQLAELAASPAAAPSTPVSDEEYERLQRSDPGAAAFFKEFDEDSNKHWKQQEFTKAMRAAIERRFLPVAFDVYGTWMRMPKNSMQEVNFRDFLAMASQITASPPEVSSTPTPAGPSTRPEGEFKHCEEMFSTYDRNKDGALSLTEFTSAVSGRIREDKVQDTYLQLPRNAGNGELDLNAWTGLCTNLFGMAASALAPAASVTSKFCRQFVCRRCLGDPSYPMFLP